MKLKINIDSGRILQLIEGAKRFEGNIPELIQTATKEGYNITMRNAPELHGRLKSKITYLVFDNEGWILSEQPPHTNIPYHVLIETGEYTAVFPKYNIRPEGAGKIAFMQKSAQEIFEMFKDKVQLQLITDIFNK